MDRAELEILEQDGSEWKIEDAQYIKEAVSDSDAIFRGLKRPGHEDRFAYTVRPTHDPDEEQPDPVPPRFGFVFVTYARSGAAPGHPIGWEVDFEERTWLRT